MPMTSSERREHTRLEQLKDRRAYRDTLIQRREDLDRKLAVVESRIRKLKSIWTVGGER